MKKANSKSNKDMADEYNFRKGVRGKYSKRYQEGTNLVKLSPDVAEVFSDTESVNEALRLLIKIAQKSTEINSP